MACRCTNCMNPGGRLSYARDMLTLARIGALLWIPAELVTDEIREELAEWGELGFVILECGCLWSIDDVGALACSEEPDCHPCKLPGHEGKLASW